MNIAKKTIASRLRWFGRVEGKNNDKMAKKIREIRVERKSKPKKKWMKVIREDISTRSVDENVISDGQSGKTRVTCM